jgi:KaiC/GvpD/RAD55 family RecA-like ATPase
LTSELSIPILSRLVPGGFKYGQLLFVVYEPDSIWYETSLTIAAQALKDGLRIEYHAYAHIPSEVRSYLTNLGVDVKKLEGEDNLRIEDSYTGQTGLGVPETPAGKKVPVQPLRLSDSSIEFAQHIKAGIPESDRRLLHIDDDTSVLLQYNDEKTVLNFVRTRMIPWARARETTYLISGSTGVGSDAFTKQVASYYDGIIDMKSEEKEDQIQHYLRIRTLRGQACDSRWRKLRLLENSEVTLAD